MWSVEGEEERSGRRRGRLVIVCGLPGSGKTTRAISLAAQYQGVRFCPDEWMAALGLSVWDSGMRDRIEALQWTVAKDLLRAGSTVIIEWGTWARTERDHLRHEAEALGSFVELCFLNVPLDELWTRIQARGLEEPPIRRSDLEQWFRACQEPSQEEMRVYHRAYS